MFNPLDGLQGGVRVPDAVVELRLSIISNSAICIIVIIVIVIAMVIVIVV